MSRSPPSVSGSGSAAALPFRSGAANPAANSSACRFAPHPFAVCQRPGEPAPVLAPLHLEDAGLRVGKDPDPVPAPFAGAVGAPTSFRACHRSIPLSMDCTICASENLAPGGRVVQSWRPGRLSRGRATGAFVSPVCGGARCAFVSQKLWPGECPRTPETTFARHVHRRGAPEQDHLMARAAHAGTASLSAVASAPPPRFLGSTIRREDVEFLGRKPETGGTPTPPGVEFVRYRGSHGLGFRQTAPQTPRMAVRAVFRARQGNGGSMTWMAATQSAKDPTHGRILKPTPVTAKLPAGGPSRDHVGRVVGHDGATLGRGPGDGVRGLEPLAARRSRGGPETPGSEGAQPPASLRRGRTECGPTE